jgi:hypothetical protein
MFKLIRKGNWGSSYDRDEHFKRFPNLEEAITELQKKGWLIIHKKPKFRAFSLNPKYKKEIIEFVEKQMPDLLKGWEK